MNEPSELDIAQLKHEMRQMYSHVGPDGALRILYEMLLGANALAEVIAEERPRDEKTN